MATSTETINVVKPDPVAPDIVTDTVKIAAVSAGAIAAAAPVMSEALQAWNDGWTWTAIKFVILTIVFLTIVVLMFTVGRLNEIAKNFPRYRCNPLFMPFAGNFGYDSKENFDFCITNVFRTKAAQVFAPIYALLGGYTDIIKLIVDVTLGIRKLFSNFLLGINGFIGNVRDRIQGLLFQVRLSFMKLQNLMGRTYGTMYAIVWMGTSAMTAGFNIADNDLVKFLFEFCFDPHTPVKMSDGSYKPIRDLKIGDTLSPVRPDLAPPKVTSVFRFDGARTPMVRIRDVVLSAEHYVIGPAGWLPAAHHPDAQPVESIPELVCVNVEGHKFIVGNTGLVVADYDEHSSPDVIQETQATAMKALNGRSGEVHNDEHYSIGIQKNACIRMADAKWKSIQNVQLDEYVWNGGKVLGVVQELAPNTVKIDGINYSNSQLIFDSENKIWKRASAHPQASAADTNDIVYSLITEKCGTLEIKGLENTHYIRDYREVALPEMENAYSVAFSDPVAV